MKEGLFFCIIMLRLLLLRLRLRDWTVNENEQTNEQQSFFFYFMKKFRERDGFIRFWWYVTFSKFKGWSLEVIWWISCFHRPTNQHEQSPNIHQQFIYSVLVLVHEIIMSSILSVCKITSEGPNFQGTFDSIY